MTVTLAKTTPARHRAGHRTPIRGNPWWTLAAVSIGVIMVGLDASVVAIANPHIAADLHATLSDLQWITDAYMLALAALHAHLALRTQRHQPKAKPVRAARPAPTAAATAAATTAVAATAAAAAAETSA